MTNTPMPGDLRVWWIPQIPGTPFYVPVLTLTQAKLIMDTLSRYDEFQLKHNVKGDYCNVGGVEIYEFGSEWVDWYDPDTGFDYDDYVQNVLETE